MTLVLVLPFGGGNVLLFKRNSPSQQDVEQASKLPHAQRLGMITALVVELGWEVLGGATELEILFAIVAKSLGGATEINEPNLKHRVIYSTHNIFIAS